MKPDKRSNNASSTVSSRNALQAAEQALGPDHHKVAVARNNLALLYHAEGKYAEAEMHLEEAISVW